MESQVIRTYLETIAELPWNKRSPEHLDIPAAAGILDEDHYGLGDVKDRVLEFLAVRQLRQAEEARKQTEEEARKAEASAASGPEGEDRIGEEKTGEEKSQVSGAPRTADEKRKAKGPILLFVGPPGVGKTSIAKSIARAMGREYVRISLGGVARRGRHPRSPAHLRRRHARPHHPGHEAGGHQEPGLPARRGRQARRLVPGRSGERAARGARPGAERHVHRSLPRRAVRSVRGAVRRHGELHPEHPGAAARPHGGGATSPATPSARSSRSPSATCCRGSSRRTG